MKLGFILASEVFWDFGEHFRKACFAEMNKEGMIA